MDPNTGQIYELQNEEEKKNLEKKLGHRVIPLTDKQAKELKPLSNRRRKALLSGGPCICGSGKSFKKCCWRKYQKKFG